MLNIRQFYLILAGSVLIIMGCAFMLQIQNQSRSHRNPRDVIWMEQVRRTTIDDLTPIRDRIHSGRPSYPSIIVTGESGVATVKTDVTKAEIVLAVEILNNARANIIETSEWLDLSTKETDPPPQGYSKLYLIKDYLWGLSLKYIELLLDIYESRRDVSYSELFLLEENLTNFTSRFEHELESIGYSVDD